MTPPDLAAITQKGWAFPVLAVIGQGAKARTYEITRCFPGASRASVLDGLEHLAALGLIEANPGHGHPLRPDWRLTDAGARIAPAAGSAWAEVRAQSRNGMDGLEEVCRRRWTLPILAALDVPRRNGDLARTLAPVTDRALSLALKACTEAALLRRDVAGDSYPPTPVYVPLPPAQAIRMALLKAEA